MRKTGYLAGAVAVLLGVSLLLLACGGSEKTAAPSPTGDVPALEGAGDVEKAAAEKPAAAKTAAEAEAAKAKTVIAQSTCPVMGGKIDPNIYVDYKGKRVYFCCAECAGKFKQDPEKYLKILADRGETVANVPGK